MNKIVIEVTSNGWETTATINGKEYKEKHVATAFGSESVEGNFESEDDIPKEIYDALNSSFPLSVCRHCIPLRINVTLMRKEYL